MIMFARRPLVTGDVVRATSQMAALTVLQDLAGCAPSTQDVVALCFSPGVRNGLALAKALGLGPSTLNTRFARTGLPTPRTCVAEARLAVAALLMQKLGAAGGDIALAMGYSSPQAFSRTVAIVTGGSVTAFRQELAGERMLTRFRETRILPFLPQWHALRLPRASEVTH